MGFRLLLVGITSGLLGIPLMATIADAQVTPDGTLNTTVTQSGFNATITNGTAAGTNLYHSFGQFSVPTGGSATFNLNTTPNITTIFSRVTGGSISNIDGIIRTINSNNPVSLFLMNPAGIIFGPNARLNIGGSFVATTANSIKFADGMEFKAINQPEPLLTVSIPIGLQMGQNPGAIQVQGTGHGLRLNASASTVGAGMGTSGLRVQPGNTLALVGGNVALAGGILSAPGGQIELGGGANGRVSLNPTAQGWTLGWEGVQSLHDIRLTGRSLLDVSGMNAGSVQVQGRQIQFANTSLVLAQNLGNLSGGNILLQSSESINLAGEVSGARSEALGSGTGSNISVITPQLSIQQGAAFNNLTFRGAASGNIQVNASVVEISGFSPLSSSGSVINTSTFGAGSAGNVSVNGDTLFVSNSGGVSSLSRGVGSSGQVTIRNLDTIVQGSNNVSPQNTRITSVAFSTGNAKTLTLDTARLQLLDGGIITTRSFSVGDGGNMRINATESILIRGSNQLSPSAIDSSVLRENAARQQQLGLSGNLTADAGTIQITTPSLTLRDGGTVSVTNQGSGDGGSISINADSIQLKNQSVIQAETTSGNGGNISLQVGSLLLLRDRSQITATAGGTGDGGNITINAPVIAGLENSDIIANAFQGRGGNIQITTKGIFGLKFRNQLTSENDITASSQFGVSGNVQINNLSVDPTTGIVQLPVELVDPSQQIATGCNAQGSRFVATGRGGLPPNPTEQVESDRPWNDLRDVSEFQHQGQSVAHTSHPTPHTPIIEATEFIRTATGEIELIAQPASGNTEVGYAPVTCTTAKP